MSLTSRTHPGMLLKQRRISAVENTEGTQHVTLSIHLAILIMLLVGTTNYADASPASGVAGALGTAAAQKAGNGAADGLKGWCCAPQEGPVGPTCGKPRWRLRMSAADKSISRRFGALGAES